MSANDQVDLLAKLGITLLLFVVGLKLDLHIIRTMGPVAVATGLMVLGMEAGFTLARRENMLALFVTRTSNGFKETATPALESFLVN